MRTLDTDTPLSKTEIECPDCGGNEKRPSTTFCFKCDNTGWVDVAKLRIDPRISEAMRYAEERAPIFNASNYFSSSYMDEFIKPQFPFDGTTND